MSIFVALLLPTTEGQKRNLSSTDNRKLFYFFFGNFLFFNTSNTMAATEGDIRNESGKLELYP